MSETRYQTILITGINGMIGSAAEAYFSSQGYGVRGLSGNPRKSNHFHWNPERGEIDTKAMDGVDVVLHLAGEPVFQRWTAAVKNRIRKSRKLGTRLLAERCAAQERPPRVLISSSGINYYGDNREETVDEGSEPGSSFLAEVCKDWEAATQPAENAGIRVLRLRTGVILAPQGGALAQMLPIFRKGLGGRVGSGKQRLSWIILDDYLGATDYLLNTHSIEGPVNMVTPNPVTNAEFASTLGNVLGKPAVVPVPAMAIKAAYGAMGKATVLGDLAVAPGVLNRAGYSFLYPELKPALEYILDKSLQED